MTATTLCPELSFKEFDALEDLQSVARSYLYVVFKIEDMEIKFDLLRSMRLAFERVLQEFGLREKPILDSIEAGVVGALRALYHEISKKLFGIYSVKVINSKKKGRRLQISSKEGTEEVKLTKEELEELLKVIENYDKYSYRINESTTSVTYELLNPKLIYEVIKLICERRAGEL
ncbi:hypothetical protein IPA_06535 [Ignicoccus pacificus DSM 13166]|uniref:Uncharacterized protein n=1 Tax=Ignicoccus pacificus DSM 13166 TaxID=940294 RepID=A0A977PL29_9CREN|nr:hypothetical protein IPA_06535 [Ignicoccus pacificus DSM 13166]